MQIVDETKFKAECARWLKAGFPSAEGEIDSIEDTPAGANLHKKLVLTSGEIFGLKTWSTFKPADGSEEDCAARDLAFNEIVRASKALIPREVFYIEKFEHPNFEKHSCVLTKWLARPYTLDDPELMSLMKSDSFESLIETFFVDYGRWSQLGVILDFRDWNPSNFVWSTVRNRLALIDMDWSFSCGECSSWNCFSPLLPLKEFIGPRSSEILGHIKTGISNMRDTMKTLEMEVTSIQSKSKCKGVKEFFQISDSKLEDNFDRELKSWTTS
jgi:hypothetical protein